MGWETKKVPLLGRVLEVVDFLVSRPRIPSRHRGRWSRSPDPDEASSPIEPVRFFSAPDPQFPDLRSHLGAGARVLDLGCGQGRNLSVLRDQGLCPVGMDRFDAQAEPPLRSRHVLRADLFALPWKAHSFDGVIAWQVLCQFPAARARVAFEEAARVLRPGGIFVLSGCYGSSSWGDRGGLELFAPFVTLTTETLEPVGSWPRLRWVVVARKSEGED